MPPPAAPATPDFERFTVLLHGPIVAEHLHGLVGMIRSWRRAYPRATVIFGASQIDADLSDVDRALWKAFDLEAHDHRRRILAEAVAAEVDALTQAPFAPPLPPLKFDDKPNNCNKMIAAVQSALPIVETEWLLRIRSDAFIHALSELREDYALHARAVGRPPALGAPLAVSPYFTLNPYLLERMSFHVSDWFNFGLTADIRDYWAVSPMEWRDAAHFESFEHPPHTSPTERAMRARMPPEMHLATNFARRHGYRTPDVFNALGYEDEGLRFIRENVIVADPRRIGLNMTKYRHMRGWYQNRMQLIQNWDWRRLVTQGVGPFAAESRRRRRDIDVHFALDRREIARRIARNGLVRRIAWLLHI